VLRQTKLDLKVGNISEHSAQFNRPIQKQMVLFFDNLESALRSSKS